MSKFHVSIVTDTQNDKKHTVIMDAELDFIVFTVGKRREDGTMEDPQQIRLNRIGAKRLKNALNAIIQSL